MNARLTSIGFYLTCIIFFGFRSKPLIHANNTLPAITNDCLIKQARGKSGPVQFEQSATENKKIQYTTGYSGTDKPVSER